MRFEKLIAFADEFTTSDRPFALARRLAIAGDLARGRVHSRRRRPPRRIPGWRLQRRLDAHGLSTAELRVLRGQEPEPAVCEHLAGDDGRLILRRTSAGGHDGGPLLDHTAEAIMSHVPRPLCCSDHDKPTHGFTSSWRQSPSSTAPATWRRWMRRPRAGDHLQRRGPRTGNRREPTRRPRRHHLALWLHRTRRRAHPPAVEAVADTRSGWPTSTQRSTGPDISGVRSSAGKRGVGITPGLRRRR